MGHDIRVHCEFYRQTDKTFQLAKIGKLLFAMEHGAESLKGKSLQTLDSVLSGKRHADTPTKDLKGVKKRRRSDAGIQQEDCEDGQEPHSTSGSSSADKTKSATSRLDDDGDEDSGDSDHDGEDTMTSGTRSPKKSRKKTAVRRQCSDVDAPERKVRNQGKRPWNDQERTAVKHRLAKLIALKMIPGKQDCLMCIAKESPVLRARTWKDVKYFVYNEIIKVKRKLAL
ncbi:uncharacterized protein LOC127620554 [Xyrauchen texanus]|uniref:uncharacterized protein LOC127620554 n=1 Tax=Xyrauchen texanus TaxID=154827 RepID=UPI0022424052|nr:uncharacterized protein LOC127620554 [Xyrauchen texanus]